MDHIGSIRCMTIFIPAHTTPTALSQLKEISRIPLRLDTLILVGNDTASFPSYYAAELFSILCQEAHDSGLRKLVIVQRIGGLSSPTTLLFSSPNFFQAKLGSYYSYNNPVNSTLFRQGSLYYINKSDVEFADFDELFRLWRWSYSAWPVFVAHGPNMDLRVEFDRI
ncbi:hypothetical protein BU16DRAFT_559992 [Lophium mytilinum]|uniref:Uncharacterized protein n=1 Tax=Lophium mytilinum TaxID=390894 RepID=A0A6A6QW21_9PEZI|nr:hypothetical protein BU16DRAFT_559992 [Lophium mytilinum]